MLDLHEKTCILLVQQDNQEVQYAYYNHQFKHSDEC